MSAHLATLVESFSNGGQPTGLEILATPFMRNAFIAGTLVAIGAGLIGYFVLLRDLPFATHAVAHIGFPGATFAALVGWPTTLGLLIGCLGGAGAISSMGRRLRDREVVTGSVLALASGLGLLFASLGSSQTGMITSILFGNVLAISASQVLTCGLIVVAVLATLAVCGRPLLFASVDPDVAAARGLPVRTLSTVFLIGMSLVVAAAVTVVGVLLIFALIVTPAAAAAKLTARPLRAVAIGTAVAIGSVWIGLLVSAFEPWPPSFTITTIACLFWLIVVEAARLSSRRRSRGHASVDGARGRQSRTH